MSSFGLGEGLEDFCPPPHTHTHLGPKEGVKDLREQVKGRGVETSEVLAGVRLHSGELGRGYSQVLLDPAQ